jgi:hypothetical protein
MAKSVILQDLISDKISLSQALDRLLVISLELEDEKVQEWVKNEKNGYKTKEVPDYRFTKVIPMGTYQLYSMGSLITYSNQVLPTMGLSAENKKNLERYCVYSGIPELLDQKAQTQNGGLVGIPVPPELFSQFEVGTNIQVTKAILSISHYSIEKIIEEVRTRVIELLTLYEKNFGNLDRFDVNLNEYSSRDMEQIKKTADAIINGGSVSNTYIINSKVKGSNIGKDNSSSKTVSTEVNPNISLPSKESLWTKFLRLFKKH